MTKRSDTRPEAKPQSTATNEALLPIRTVAALTGIKTGTLRIWELRYHLLDPVRTDTGHRLYTQRDVDKLNEVQRLLHSGINISQVCAQLATKNGDDTATPQPPRDNLTLIRESMARAISAFDERELNTTYNDAIAVYPLDIVTHRMLLPLLADLGARWADGTGGIAEEHFFTHFLRNKLGARLHHRDSISHGPRILLACLPHERHEIGLLLFANYLMDAGCRATILGPDLPLAETARVAERGDFAALVLSGSSEEAFLNERDALADLTARLPIPVFVGGGIAIRHAKEIIKCGAILAGTDMRQGWEIMREHFRRSAAT